MSKHLRIKRKQPNIIVRIIQVILIIGFIIMDLCIECNIVVTGRQQALERFSCCGMNIQLGREMPFCWYRQPAVSCCEFTINYYKSYCK